MDYNFYDKPIIIRYQIDCQHFLHVQSRWQFFRYFWLWQCKNLL